MKKVKAKTYIDTLMHDSEFKKEFENEYAKLLVSEEIAKLRKSVHLTQEALAEKIDSTKSAISRYESASYRGYSLSLLGKIAHACDAEVEIKFVKHSGKRRQSKLSH